MTELEEVMEGLRIFTKYDPKGSVAAEHDILYAGPDDSVKMDPKDKKALEKAGWSYDHQFGCWSRFV